MNYPYILSFKNNVSLHDDGYDGMVLITPVRKMNFKVISPGMRDVLTTLLNNGDTEEGLCDLIKEREGSENFARFYYILHQIREHGLIQFTVNSGKDSLVTLESTAPQFKYREIEIGPDRQFHLSRFTCCHMVDGRIVLETPTGYAKLTLHNHISAAMFYLLSEPCTASSLCEIIREISIDKAKAFLELLLNVDAVLEVDGKGAVSEEEGTALSQWEFHDMLFHARSRYGRHSSPVGNTYRFLDKIEPLPAVKPKMDGETIALYKPDIDKLRQNDLPFTYVIEERMSICEYAEVPLTVEQVGEFLYRCARIRNIMDAIPEKGLYTQVSNRPYAGAGAIYVLELYLTVNRCSDLEKGMYHYCPKEHDLTRISGFNEGAVKLLMTASSASGREELPDVLITYAARYQRIMWKYQTLAYAAILKDVGVLMQNMYLVATAMGLAPCAIGDGDSDLFAEVSGLDYYTEGSVGEFILGSKDK